MSEMAAQIKNLAAMMKDLQDQNSYNQPKKNSLPGASDLDTGHFFPGFASDMKGQSYSELFAPKSTTMTPDSSNEGGVHDPRITLCNKAQCKVVHITDFLNEKTRSRRRNKHRDLVLSTADESHASVILRSEEPHPYSGISLAEWNGANMRVMNHLLSIGQLLRTHVEYYLAYTAIVCDFYDKYEWESILAFDHQYRIQQATYSFNWGSINPVMELQILVPLSRVRRDHGSSNRTAPSLNQTPLPSETRQECRQWKARGHCVFGSSCKYIHVPFDVPTTASLSTAPTEPKNGPQHRGW